ncbi:hypothetical protein, variant 1 [Phialophora macrospora]|uniref:Uncharacterized protein n=1 Tax=Phialophora macrospora TaxID=1851006 RepID=A0A0D2FQ23_9EURO|nr:hypothetical protein PV04_04610 [Phialophora macrospora]KIW68685.1 hypothetical protein, variant 1 [Phialophora macrospora]
MSPGNRRATVDATVVHRYCSHLRDIEPLTIASRKCPEYLSWRYGYFSQHVSGAADMLQNMTLFACPPMELSEMATSSLGMKLTGPQTSFQDVKRSRTRRSFRHVFGLETHRPCHLCTPPAPAPHPSDDALALHATSQNLFYSPTLLRVFLIGNMLQVPVSDISACHFNSHVLVCVGSAEGEVKTIRSALSASSEGLKHDVSATQLN